MFHKKEEMMGTICIYIVQLGSMLAPISSNLDRVGAPSLDVQTRVIDHFGGALRGTNRSLSGVGHFDTSNFDAEIICGHWALDTNGHTSPSSKWNGTSTNWTKRNETQDSQAALLEKVNESDEVIDGLR